MSTTLNDIKKPVAEEMRAFEKQFREAMRSSVPLLDSITHYIVKRKGKQMRPLFVFLTASLTGKITPATHRAGILIELLHTATLVHDDVVDDSNERRGFFSLNALWKNKIAVLVGDYLLSRGLLLSTQHDDLQLLKLVSDAVRLMSEGELLQIEKARKLDIKESIYFDIITRKTASLIAACCACGAASSGSDEQTIEKLRLFGEKAGIAFQIKDDLFDYEQSAAIGKPTGIDIKEQKMTLPLIYTLDQSDSMQKRKIIRLVKKGGDDPEKVRQVIDFVKQSGGIEYAEQTMLRYRQEALNLLFEFPESEARIALEQLLIFTTNRKY